MVNEILEISAYVSLSIFTVYFIAQAYVIKKVHFGSFNKSSKIAMLIFTVSLTLRFANGLIFIISGGK